MTEWTPPRPARAPFRQDAGALIGVLAILKGWLSLNQLDPVLADQLRQRFVYNGLLATANSSDRELRQALSDMSQRLH
jgi:hypothetical protein